MLKPRDKAEPYPKKMIMFDELTNAWENKTVDNDLYFP